MIYITTLARLDYTGNSSFSEKESIIFFVVNNVDIRKLFHIFIL